MKQPTNHIKKLSYKEILESFINKKVYVEDKIKNSFEGVCIALNYQHLNVIIKTSEGLICIKDIAYISTPKKAVSICKV